VAQSARAQSRDITWPTDGCCGVAESRRVDLQRTRELQFKPILTFKETRSHVATSSRAADSGNVHPCGGQRARSTLSVGQRDG
jgi:hypothetical protein